MKEYDLEILLEQEFKTIFEKINIDSEVLINLNEFSEKYSNYIVHFNDIVKIDLQSYIEFDQTVTSHISNTMIEGEEITIKETFSDIDKLKEYYFDEAVIEDFYYNFKTNIKKINRCVSKKDPGKFRSELRKHALITTKYGNLLPADYRNINKYIEQLVSLNLLKGNNLYIEAWVIHCLFEAIHPFSDGNGRVGRFILNNHLNQQAHNKTYLDTTILENRDKYYEALFAFQVEQDFTKSLNLFLELVLLNYSGNMEIVNKYIANYTILIAILKRDKYLLKYRDEIISILFTKQVISKTKIYKTLNKSDKTNKKILEYMEDNNYLKKVSTNLYRPIFDE